jgi:hypothetical protein
MNNTHRVVYAQTYAVLGQPVSAFQARGRARSPIIVGDGWRCRCQDGESCDGYQKQCFHVGTSSSVMTEIRRYFIPDRGDRGKKNEANIVSWVD